MDQPWQDRRKYPRVRTEVLVRVRRVEGATQLARGLDLGMGGIRFQCFGLELAVGEVIEATLALGNNNRVTVVGKTVRVTNTGGTQDVALAFERLIDPETLKRLCERSGRRELERVSDYGPDRRKHLRVPMMAVRAVLSCPKPSVGVNLSVGGIRFYSAILGVEVGDTLHVELVLQGRSIAVVGTVVRVSGLDGSAREISLAFSEIDPEAQRLLAETLASTEQAGELVPSRDVLEVAETRASASWPLAWCRRWLSPRRRRSSTPETPPGS